MIPDEQLDLALEHLADARQMMIRAATVIREFVRSQKPVSDRLVYTAEEPATCSVCARRIHLGDAYREITEPAPAVLSLVHDEPECLRLARNGKEVRRG